MVTAVARGRMMGPDEEDDNKQVYKDRVFCTQEYIPWVIGSLRLGDKVDMGRVRRDQVKVLVGHNGQNPIGRVTRARHDRDGACFRSDLEIPKIDVTMDARQRIEAGLMRDISVGAKLNWDAITLDNPDDDWQSMDDIRWTAHEWEVVEESMTPIPADGRAGMDRAEILDLVRENEDIVVFTADSVIMAKRTVDAVEARFSQMLNERRRGTAMTTPVSIADTLEKEKRDALARQAAENDQIALIREMATLGASVEEQRKLNETLQGELRSARTTIEEITQAHATETDEQRGFRESFAGLQTKHDEAEAARVAMEEKWAAERQENMEYREKLDRMQFQPAGQVLQLSNWKPGENILSLGNILKLTWKGGMSEDSPQIDASAVTLEESFLERRDSDLKAQTTHHRESSNTVAFIPWSAMAERERQELMVRNSTLTSGAGVRPLDITVLGDAGLVLSRYAPIMARMDVRMGVVGDQRLSYLTAQDAPAPVTEGGAIAAGTWTVEGESKQPRTIPAAFQMTTSLRAIDDGTFEGIVRNAIFLVLNNGVLKQILVGSGVAPQIPGIWSTTNVVNVDYGAAQTNFDRQDMLDVLNSVRLSNTDGAAPIMVASRGLWRLAEQTPRATATFGPGTTSGGGITDIQRFLLDDIMHQNMGVMGMVEGAECFYYDDLAIASINDPGLVFKPDRAVVWFWGDSLNLEYVPQTSANYYYKMVAECNADYQNPAQNFARIKRT